MKNNIDIINSIIENYVKKKCVPYYTTEGSINNKECGNHRGLYYIYPELNFYFGLSSKKNATIIARHETHRAKLDVNINKLFGPARKKKEPSLQFPIGWQEGICKYIIDEVDEIPQYFKKTVDGFVEPIYLDFSVKHLIDVDKIQVIIWNLNEYPPETIEAIEDKVIETIYPYCNKETAILRNKLNKIFLATNEVIKKYDNYEKQFQICSAYFQKEILKNECKQISHKNFNKLKFARQYFIDNQNKFDHVLKVIFIEWCKILER